MIVSNFFQEDGCSLADCRQGLIEVEWQIQQGNCLGSTALPEMTRLAGLVSPETSGRTGDSSTGAWGMPRRKKSASWEVKAGKLHANLNEIEAERKAGSVSDKLALTC